jgi:hypothetical protein
MRSDSDEARSFTTSRAVFSALEEKIDAASWPSRRGAESVEISLAAGDFQPLN